MIVKESILPLVRGRARASLSLAVGTHNPTHRTQQGRRELVSSSGLDIIPPLTHTQSKVGIGIDSVSGVRSSYSMVRGLDI